MKNEQIVLEALIDARELLELCKLYKGYGAGPLRTPWAIKVNRQLNDAIGLLTK